MECDSNEDTTNSVEGKLMQGEAEAPANTEGKTTKKKGSGDSPFDIKIHIYIRRHSFKGDSSVKRYRADVRRCCIYFLLALILLAIVGVGIFLIVYFTEPGEEDLVKTKNGALKGRHVLSPQGVQIAEYLGIPFAKPPIGNLRYADPVPIEQFPADPYEATDYQNSCIQWLDETFGDFQGSAMWNAPNPLSEDCLYLNIWLPKARKTKRTVMVWIYGGGFYSGSNALWVYDGKALAAHGDVIVVSMNYRVDTFGYLSTGDGRIKGNFGMKDQFLALKWIRDNIEAFGGDPDQVTIFGESSGASSIGLHMMSDYSSGLFKRAIFESGSPDSHWAFMTQKQAQERSELFFKNVNCTDKDTAELLKCLRAIPPHTIKEQSWVDGHFMVFPWAPTVDGDYLKDTPYNLLKSGKFEKKDSLLGVNLNEGSFWITYLSGFEKDGENLLNNTRFVNYIKEIDWDLTDSQRQDVYRRYAPSSNDDFEGYRDQLEKLTGDRSFTCPTTELTTILTNTGVKTYLYYLTHRATNEVWGSWMGVIHGAEIQWIFGMPMNKSRGYTKEEEQFSMDIMSYWVNFAKTGDPNEADLPFWPNYTNTTHEHLQLRSPSQFSVNNTLREDMCTFWNDINSRFYTDGV